MASQVHEDGQSLPEVDAVHCTGRRGENAANHVLVVPSALIEWTMHLETSW